MFGIKWPRLIREPKKVGNKVYIDNVINEKETGSMQLSSPVIEEDTDSEKETVDETVKKIMEEVIEEVIKEKPVELPPLSETAIQNFICPISMEIMIDPVTNRDGYTFEREAIIGWLKSKHTCPMSRNPMCQTDLIPNRSLKKTIMWYRHHKLLPPLLPNINGEDEENGESNRYNSGQLPPIDIPEHPDLSFLDVSDRNMIEPAYRVMNRLGAWDYVRRYSPSRYTGYTFDPDLGINRILGEIHNDYSLHSGVSIGYTMRRIEFIAKNGLALFKQQYIDANRD